MFRRETPSRNRCSAHIDTGTARRKTMAPAPEVLVLRCTGWNDLRESVKSALQHVKLAPGEEPWFRGAGDSTHNLLPSLFWRGAEFEDEVLDRLESDLFFEFQARARELHERSLSDWDYLFFMRHHRVPTRILDWTDSFGIAAYFALESLREGASGAHPCIWVLNPYSLNRSTWGIRDLVQPRYLGSNRAGTRFMDYGALLARPGKWLHDGPVAVYPLQISERMRAQRGWFTMFGNSRTPLELGYPDTLARIDLDSTAVEHVREFVDMAGLRPYSIYPDLEHLGIEVLRNNFPLMKGSGRLSEGDA